LTLPLKGPGGEPIDLRRTLCSHGFVDLAPNVPDDDYRGMTTTLALRSGARTIHFFEGSPGTLTIDVTGPRPGARARSEILRSVHVMLALDDDLSQFYALLAGDPILEWATKGAGRLYRSPTAFEDVIKTILTTNCAWSATIRMNNALVEHLGVVAPGGAHAFPTPQAMADAPLSFYRDIVRAGYRGPYLRSLAKSVANAELDLEALRAADRTVLDDEALEMQLRALPGVGPYAAAHIMMLFGRRHRLVLDSATRPRYAKLSGRKAKDSTIIRKFARYRNDAGLAFWLYITRHWIKE
jgi:N-glycosylase/DNA lyase